MIEVLPAYVHRRKRDGALLFRKRYGAKIFARRLVNQSPENTPLSQATLDEVDILLNGDGDEGLKYRAPKPAPQTPKFIATDGRCLFSAMERSARARAKKYGYSYNLPNGWCRGQAQHQEWKCAVTAIPFRQDMTKRSPFMPSLDRADPKRGYHPDNCRIVAYIVNCALGQFGEAAFIEMCEAATVLYPRPP